MQEIRSQNSNGVMFVILFAIALFLVYAVEHHMITDSFSYLMSRLFDNFSIKSTSIMPDIVILIAFLLMLFGLFCLFKFFMAIAFSVIIVGILAWVFLAPSSPPEVKIQPSEKHEKVYGG